MPLLLFVIFLCRELNNWDFNLARVNTWQLPRKRQYPYWTRRPYKFVELLCRLVTIYHIQYAVCVGDAFDIPSVQSAKRWPALPPTWPHAHTFDLIKRRYSWEIITFDSCAVFSIVSFSCLVIWNFCSRLANGTKITKIGYMSCSTKLLRYSLQPTGECSFVLIVVWWELIVMSFWPAHHHPSWDFMIFFLNYNINLVRDFRFRSMSLCIGPFHEFG